MKNIRINKPRRQIYSVDELPVLCTAAEAGLLLRQNPETITKMARNGILPGLRQGRSWLFRREDLVAYINGQIRGVGGDAV